MDDFDQEEGIEEDSPKLTFQSESGLESGINTNILLP